MPVQPTVQMLPEWPQEAQGGRLRLRAHALRYPTAGHSGRLRPSTADRGWVKTCLSRGSTLVALLGAPEGAEALWTPDSGLSNREHPDESPLPSGIHAPINSSRCSFPRTRGTPGLLEHQGRRPSLVEGRCPPANGVGIPFQGLRRTHCGPALGQQQHGAPAFPLPGRRRQNHPPVQTPDSHLTLLEMLVHPSHTHYQPPWLPDRLAWFLPNLPNASAHFTAASV